MKHFAWDDAIFLAELLHNELYDDESLFILADANFRAGRVNVCHSIFETHHSVNCHLPRCVFLFSKSCYELKKYHEAFNIFVNALPPPLKHKNIKFYSRSQFVGFFGDKAAFAAQLLASIHKQLDENKMSIHYYYMSMEINPFLWSSFEQLVMNSPDQTDPEKLFIMKNYDFKLACGSRLLDDLYNENSMHKTAPIMDQYFDKDRSPISNAPFQGKIEIASPFAIINESSDSKQFDVFTPSYKGLWSTASLSVSAKNDDNEDGNSTKPSSDSDQMVTLDPPYIAIGQNYPDSSSSTISPEIQFGVLSLTNKLLEKQSVLTEDPIPSIPTQEISDETPKARAVPFVRRKLSIESEETPQPEPVALRRSSRLYTKKDKKSSNSDQADSSSSVHIPKRSRKVYSPAPDSPIVAPTTVHHQESTESSLETETSVFSNFDWVKSAENLQRKSVSGLLQLLCDLGEAYRLLLSYECEEALEKIDELPIKHKEGGFVETLTGRVYFEMNKYTEATTHFRMARIIEPYRVKGMEYFSTALWHQQNEDELSSLAHDLKDFDENCPETWCVVGNCFSLLKENEKALDALERATQIGSQFAYAYNLLGHEWVMANELDQALLCFQYSTILCPRLYTGWYGQGMVYFKKQLYSVAQDVYLKALSIFPTNTVLMCHLAIAMHHNSGTDDALSVLLKALEMEPKNPLLRFNLASLYFSIRKYEDATRELDLLKEICPKESMVYFLSGKVSCSHCLS